MLLVACSWVNVVPHANGKCMQFTAGTEEKPQTCCRGTLPPYFSRVSQVSLHNLLSTWAAMHVYMKNFHKFRRYQWTNALLLSCTTQSTSTHKAERVWHKSRENAGEIRQYFSIDDKHRSEKTKGLLVIDNQQKREQTYNLTRNHWNNKQENLRQTGTETKQRLFMCLCYTGICLLMYK